MDARATVLSLLGDFGRCLGEHRACERRLLGSSSPLDEAEEQRLRSLKASAEAQLQALVLSLDVLLGPGMVDKAVAMCQPRRASGRQRGRSAGPAEKRRPFVRFICEASGRRCHHVRGESGAGGDGSVYLCVEGFCSCRSFVNKLSAGTPFCKHLVALELAQLTDLVAEECVGPAAYTRSLSSTSPL